jgi:putative colanic acid biosysnthesis UDP-glucose lipid carrier transferase
LFHRFNFKAFPKASTLILSTAIRHTETTVETWAPHKIPGLNQNGIIYPFVASRKRYLFVKRAFDIVFSFLVIVLFMSWLVPLVALLIKLDSAGPVFFRQRRIGINGKIFLCFKFRTMSLNEEADERPAEENDDRITRVGKFLRLTNIDEFPQFFNVLKGDMSVIGPRPHMITDCIRFSFVISSYSYRNLVRPGITGWAQVNGHHGPTLDYESIIIRYYWDAMYVAKLNARLDSRIIVRTFFRAVRMVFYVLYCVIAKPVKLLLKNKTRTYKVTG